MKKVVTLTITSLLTLVSLGAYLYVNAKIVEGEKLLSSGQAQYDKGQKALAAGEGQLAAGKQKLATVKAVRRQANYVPLIGTIKHTPIIGRETLGRVDSKIASGDRQVAAGEQQVQAGKAKLAAGKKALAAGRAQLAQAKIIRFWLGLSTCFFAVLTVLLGFCLRRSK